MSEKEKKGTNNSHLKRYLPFFSIPVIIIVIAFTSFMFFTWLIKDVFKVEGIYISALLILYGTFIVLMVVLIPMYVAMYKNKKKALETISDAIKKVANGDYGFKIEAEKENELTPVYEDFNKMSAELESVQILRNDFINNYSHEFKTPIASINGFASLLLEKNISEEERKQYLEIIVEESSRLSNLAANTILLSKLNSQQIVADIEKYDLSEQLRQCSIILSKAWLDKKIKFVCDIPEVDFYGNKELLQHLWINILGNAVKYTSSGEKIYVNIMPDNEWIKVEISDTGEGMDEETINHLFEPYYQGDTSHSRQGLGLGLAICKRIVELCGGKISVHSKKGVGSAVTVILPKNKKEINENEN